MQRHVIGTGGRGRPGRSATTSPSVSTVLATAAVTGAVAIVAVVTLLGSSPAFGAAAGSNDGSGTVSVGVSDGGPMPGAPATTAGGADGTSPWTCTSTSLLLNDEGGFAPGGPTPGGWFSVTCIDGATGASTTQTEWITAQTPAAAPAVDPRTVALQAERSLTLPSPTLYFNPATSVVNLSTWLWIDPTVWHPYSVTASVGTVSATAVATPVAVTWTMGDGGAVTCAGPGRPYVLSDSDRHQDTDCQYTYRTSSLGQPTSDGNPDAADYRVRATVTWSVSWVAVGAEGQGTLPSLTTSAVAPVRVVQIESVDTDGSGGAALSVPRSTAVGGAQ